ncbi:hypothetical protein [Aneurinibacillus thermoaerophilus]|uniref:hypothetical protein n=1 Tax=Aneurinibacillus thermoaerophilus TaxID=143495 RepID=UPI002E248989|nr:hypothetical protein [Aneurinibacillus thermoaerophilus]MED0757120.1 hypothetical protein [Aneurinibacillus thermoaerophilus]MED0759359.1 hypothetical protein [Aneurinibacillus thermoaerophilus]
MIKIEMKNTNENILVARKFRDKNKYNVENFNLYFSEDNSTIIIEGNKLLIPCKKFPLPNIKIKGLLHPRGEEFELVDGEKGKTVNLHLDAELVKEINAIRSYVKSKTQHEALLEVFKKGLEQYKKEQGGTE